MNHISEILEGVRTVGIAGHIHPDGDCVGSCMGLYLYLKKNYPELQADIYLEQPAPIFGHIACIDEILTEAGEEKEYDLFVTLDASSPDRIAVGFPHFQRAKKTVCIDHHISNTGFAMLNHVEGKVGSASEVLYTLLDPDKVDVEIAKAIYTGMIHDTGVFQYSSTTSRTLRIAGELMDKGFDFSRIIDESFYQKSFKQTLAMGLVLADCKLFFDGGCILGCMTLDQMEEHGMGSKDLDGIVSQMRLTKGVEVAVLLYEMEKDVFKASLRSSGTVDVSKVSVSFGGGGHAKAAGCTLMGDMDTVVRNITEALGPLILEAQGRGV
ncbi:MAG: DHH family phosphoesterase [Clostridiales bacterium]|nr:DHH family phosphoesterase [Candidatus Blautia equi]